MFLFGLNPLWLSLQQAVFSVDVLVDTSWIHNIPGILFISICSPASCAFEGDGAYHSPLLARKPTPCALITPISIHYGSCMLSAIFLVGRSS